MSGYSPSSRKRNKSYSAVFQRYANRIKRGSSLSNVSLSNLLSGDTCYPISLKEFEGYLRHKEYSIENLQFIVWYQDYRKRFLALPDKLQRLSPGRKDFAFAIPTPARTAQRAAESMRNANPDNHDAGFLPIFPTESPAPGVSRMQRLSLHGSEVSTSIMPLLRQELSRTSDHLESVERPFHTECMRVVATFLRPGGSKELPLDPVVRDTVIRNLIWNTHPDVFLPAYEEIYHMLETVSLPRFLTGACANINLPKQLFWYGAGVVNVILSIVIAIVLITTVSTPPQTNRAWRLFSVPLAGIGFMQIYSAWRGFCSQVWGRGHTQLRAWEMQDVDEEANDHWESVLGSYHGLKKDGKAAVTVTERVRTVPPPVNGQDVRNGLPADDMSAIAPFAATDSASYSTASTNDRSSIKTRQSSSASDERPQFTRIPRLSLLRRKSQARSAARSSPRAGINAGRHDLKGSHMYRKPPVFGPENVVLDPRIQAVHEQIMRHILYAGFFFTLGFTAVVLAVPALHH